MAAIEQSAQRAQRLAGRTVVITGSSSGIGRAIALRAAHEGAQAVSDVRPDPVEGGEPTEAGIARASTCAVSSSAANGRSPRCSSRNPSAGFAGRVINIASQHGLVGTPGHVAYSTSKGGVINLTRQLAVDYGPREILVNAVAPGKILTGAGDFSEEPIEYSRSRTPFFRLGRPSDVAAAVAFLASDDALYVSGTNLLVDGGWMAY
jgi:NAD(P)-dependent dehydrogenase (short-subunit alcohol dehydrogenase family)